MSDKISDLVKVAKTLREIDEDKSIANKRAKAAPVAGAVAGAAGYSAAKLAQKDGVGTRVNLGSRKVEHYVRRKYHGLRGLSPASKIQYLRKTIGKGVIPAAALGGAAAGAAGKAYQYAVHEKARKEAGARRKELKGGS